MGFMDSMKPMNFEKYEMEPMDFEEKNASGFVMYQIKISLELKEKLKIDSCKKLALCLLKTLDHFYLNVYLCASQLKIPIYC